VEGDAYCVISSGEVDLFSAPLFDDALDDALASSSPVVVIDLTRIRYIDSAGLNAILKCRKALLANQRDLRVAADLGGHPFRVLHTTGLDSLLHIYGSLEEALAG